MEYVFKMEVLISHHIYRPNIVTKHRPRAHFGQIMGSHDTVGGLLVHSDMDIVDQTQLFSKLDPFHEQFIPAPSKNAGI